MNRVHSMCFIVTVSAASVSLSACGPYDDEDYGLLTVEWSILSTFDPELCLAYDADAFELVIFDRFGGYVTEIEAPCEDFGLTVELTEGFYEADATLVDRFDRAVTLTETLIDVAVVENTELIIDLNFPRRSIL